MTNKKNTSTNPQTEEMILDVVEALALTAQYRLDKLFAAANQLIGYKRALAGERLWEYNEILRRAGYSKSAADKLILLAETFYNFPTKNLRFIKEATLFKLCKPVYSDIVDQMRERTDLTEAMVQEWIKEVKEPKKKRVPKPQEIKTGWQENKEGENKSYAVVQDEETGKAIEELAKTKNTTPQELTKQAIAEYQLRHIQSAEDYWNAELDSAAIAEATTWEDVERAVNKDKNRFVRAIKNWAQEKKDRVTETLAAFLSENPHSLTDLVWLPTSLVIKALLRSLLPYDKLAVIA